MQLAPCETFEGPRTWSQRLGDNLLDRDCCLPTCAGPILVSRDAVDGGPKPALLPKLLRAVSTAVANVFLPP